MRKLAVLSIKFLLLFSLVFSLAACSNSSTGSSQSGQTNSAAGFDSTSEQSASNVSGEATTQSETAPPSAEGTGSKNPETRTPPSKSEEENQNTVTNKPSNQNSTESKTPSNDTKKPTEQTKPTETDKPYGTTKPSEPEPKKTNILIAYFSCTGTTKPLAEYAADALGADLYEIVPETPYTDADLNYNNSSSRANREQDDPSARPAISGSVSNMEQYDIVFIGYPIWWGQAPRIISTFLESHDFSGKTIVPFCTSHSSGIGSSDRNLHSLCSDSTDWIAGKRFASGTSKKEIVNWINGLDLGVTAK